MKPRSWNRGDIVGLNYSVTGEDPGFLGSGFNFTKGVRYVDFT